jgi:hypothetical protein
MKLIPSRILAYDLAVHRRPDAGDLLQAAGSDHLREVLGQSSQGLGNRVIRTTAKRVLALHFEEPTHLFQDLGDA